MSDSDDFVCVRVCVYVVGMAHELGKGRHLYSKAAVTLSFSYR